MKPEDLRSVTYEDDDPDVEEILARFDPYIVAQVKNMARRSSNIARPEVLDLEIDEITQRVRIKFWNALKAKEIEHHKAYIRTIVSNEFNDLGRQRKAPLPLPTDEDGELYMGNVLLSESKGLNEFNDLGRKRKAPLRKEAKSSTFKYKGYVGQVELDLKARILFGKVVGLKDVITFQGKTPEEAEQAFHNSVDAYLAFCERQGKNPERSFSGNIPFRTTSELHQRMYLASQMERQSINSWLNTIIAAAVEKVLVDTGEETSVVAEEKSLMQQKTVFAEALESLNIASETLESLMVSSVRVPEEFPEELIASVTALVTASQLGMAQSILSTLASTISQLTISQLKNRSSAGSESDQSVRAKSVSLRFKLVEEEKSHV